MNIRDRVHFVLQDSFRLNSLAILCLSHNELKSIDTYCRLAINNGVGYQCALGCQQPDFYNGKGDTGYVEDSNGFGKRVATGFYFRQLQAANVSSAAEDSNPQKLRSALQSKRSDSVSDQVFVDRH